MTAIKYALLTILALLLFGTGVERCYALNDIEGLEAFLDGVMASQMDENNVSGATLSVVKDGEVILIKGYGYGDLDKREPVDPDRSLFRVGSTAKLFTWTAVMQLVEKGELDIDQDINIYLDFTIPSNLMGERIAREPITLKHLLTHTPGFEDVGLGLFVQSEEEMVSLQEYVHRYLPERIFSPGEVMAYSNYGAALAGYIVERVSGEAFEDYIEEHIFEPLQLKHSTIRQPLPDDLAPNLARAYNYIGGEYHRGGFEYISGTPAGSMSSTASDMARFMIAHLQGGSYDNARILKDETTAEMHRQQFSHHPEVDGMTYGFIEHTFNCKRVITHGGDTQMYHTGLFLIPDENLGLFVSSLGTGIRREVLFQAFMDRYFPVKEINIPEPSPGASERSLQYVGEYRPNRSNFSTFEKLMYLLQPIKVNINEEGYLQVSLYREILQFAEIEPGFYRYRYPYGTQMARNLSFQDGPGGKILMAPDGPMTFTKTPWYGTTSFVSLLTGGGFLLIIGSLIGWLVSFFLRLLRKETREKSEKKLPATAARITVLLFGLLTTLFLFGIIGIFNNIDPAYGAPRVFFGLTPAATFILNLPKAMALLGSLLVIFTALSWWKGYWNTGARIHYSMITAAAMAILWVTSYAKLLW